MISLFKLKKHEAITRILLLLLSLLLAAMLTSCQEDEETGSIENSWEGDKYEINGFVSDVPIAVYTDTNEDFNVSLIFEEDGTLIVSKDATETEGSWEWVSVNKKISITADLGIEYLDPTEVFDIKELTKQSLVLYIQKYGTFERPDTKEEVSGVVKVILTFNKAS